MQRKFLRLYWLKRILWKQHQNEGEKFQNCYRSVWSMCGRFSISPGVSSIAFATMRSEY